jgi:SAM-dependent methyltransferase
MTAAADPWADYWRRAEAAQGSACLPEAGATLAPLLEECWRSFALMLPRRGRLLDLATGGGAVPAMLRAAAPALELVGVDQAPDLPKRPGMQLKGGVAIERLPFPDRRFDAVTSQFGIEYGDAERAAAEAARVLRAGGRLRFLLHHAQGPVVAHNRARGAAIDWAVRGSGLFAKARALAAARGAMPTLPTPPAFAEAVGEAARLFPGQSAAAEIAEALRRTLEMGRGRPPAETLEVLGELERRAGSELGRIEALLAAACTPERVAALRACLEGCRLEVDAPATLGAAGAPPFAWRVDARKPT